MIKPTFKKTKLKPLHWFYISFFVLYALFQYYFLYHINDLQPFQVNYHFFSNVAGSFSKRFLSEAAPYALLFYLLYYTRKQWKRIILLFLFNVAFLINVLTIAFYAYTRSNFQFYILEGFNWSILTSFLDAKTWAATLIMIGLLVFLNIQLIKAKARKKPSPLRFRFHVASLLIISLASPLIPVLYDDHGSLFMRDQWKRKTFRIAELERSGASTLQSELLYHYFPPTPVIKPLSDEDQKQISALGLNEQSTTDFPTIPSKIIVVFVESLNQDFISYYNPELEGLTPNLDQLFRQYPSIDQFYPSGVYTLHGVTASMCGHVNVKQSTENIRHHCAPKLLSENLGFKNYFFRGASRYYLEENIHFKKFGFDTIVGKEDLAELYHGFKRDYAELYNNWGYTDDYVFNEAVEVLKKKGPDERVLLSLLTVDTHAPGGRCYQDKANENRGNLRLSISCLDSAIADFMNRLETEGLFDDETVILITADQLYPRRSDLPGSDFQNSFAFQPNEIPFLLISKNKYSLSRQGSHADIASTLLDITNIDIPPYYMGKSLVSSPNVRPLGQDRLFGYVIDGSVFYPLALDYPEFEKYRAVGAKILRDRSPIKKISEIDIGLIDEGFLYNWYYNRFNNLADIQK